jgi:hypothetical protein
MDVKKPSKVAVFSRKKLFSELFMTFIATTLSIVLTFGTAEWLERREKKQAQKQMCMMILYDIDQSIEQIRDISERIDTMFGLQQQLKENPKLWEDLSFKVQFSRLVPFVAFRDSYEKIFTSSPAIWETLGDAVFIDNVNQCYFLRKHVADDVLTPLQEDIQKGLVDAPVEKVLDFDFAELAYINKSYIFDMEQLNEYNKFRMHITQEDMKAFSKGKDVDFNQQYYDSLNNAALKEYSERVHL